jgi:hypothetical protein
MALPAVVVIVWLARITNLPASPRVAAVGLSASTLNDAVPVLSVAGSVAVIVIGPPKASAVASPLKPAALLIVATAAFEDVQVTEVVNTLVVASEYVPVAIYC